MSNFERSHFLIESEIKAKTLFNYLHFSTFWMKYAPNYFLIFAANQELEKGRLLLLLIIVLLIYVGHFRHMENGVLSLSVMICTNWKWVRLSVGWLVFHNFVKGREVSDAPIRALVTYFFRRVIAINCFDQSKRERKNIESLNGISQSWTQGWCAFYKETHISLVGRWWHHSYVSDVSNLYLYIY